MIEQFLANLEKILTFHPLLGLGASFLAGILVSFSPCIYPLIPITLGVVGAASSSTRRQGFLLSASFVLGIAIVYTALGTISALLGVLFWKFFINPITYMLLAFVFLFLGASCFELIRVKIPFSVHYKRWIGKGFVSVLILGMISGLAIIPCNYPVLGAILSLISLRGSVFYGAIALFLFSLGYGFLLIILGTFSSLIRKLPKEGIWIIIVERSLGVIFAGVGIYFLLKFISAIS